MMSLLYGIGGGGSATEWGNITGTLSAQTDLQTALDGKVNDTGDETIAGTKTFSSAPIVSALTASRILTTDGSKVLTSSSVTTTTLGYLDATSSIQTQLDAKAATSVTDALKVEQFTGFIETATNKTYVLDQYAKFAYTINDITTKMVSGTLTLAVKINGTDVTSLSAISCTSSEATTTATGANSVAVGDTVTLVVSSVSSPVDLAFTLKYTRS